VPKPLRCEVNRAKNLKQSENGESHLASATFVQFIDSAFSNPTLFVSGSLLINDQTLIKTVNHDESSSFRCHVGNGLVPGQGHANAAGTPTMPAQKRYLYQGIPARGVRAQALPVRQ
jgi:hypothetical protein